MLVEAGIGPSSRVLVMHPMAPWSIGQVFFEGAATLGAQVFPVGLSLRAATLSRLLDDFAPTVICAGGRNLARVLQSLELRSQQELARCVELVLTAGELLEQDVRAELRRLLECDVRDIYGCAELDALAIEGASAGIMHLVPDYQYRLLVDGTTEALVVGRCGQLEVCDQQRGREWHNTGDQVMILAPECSDNPWGTPNIRIEGRTDLVVAFGDGCAVGQRQLLELTTTAGLSKAQLQVTRSPKGDSVVLMCSLGTGLSDAQAIERQFLDLCTDFADALQAGCIKAFTVRLADDSSDFWDTERSKTPDIVTRMSTPGSHSSA